MRVFCRMLCALLLVAPAAAQIPDTFKNLEVLPKDITRPQLIATMRGIAGSLGVRCMHCHVGPDNLQGMDFATDEKPTKRAARMMLKMVRDMNAQYVSKLAPADGPRQEVGCVMCHRRNEKPPRQLNDVLMATIKAQGVDAAITQYRTLRKDQMLSGTYDFRLPSLGILASMLRDEKRLDDALAIMKLNAEMFPESPDAQIMLGDASQEKGDLDTAESAYKRALQLQPDHPRATNGLKQVQAKRKPKE